MPEQTLAQRVRAKYPGAYDDLSDAELEASVKKKFPGVYDDLPTSEATAAPAPVAPKPPTTPAGGPAPWSLNMLAQTARTTSDPAVGALKGAANTVVGMGEAAYNYIPGVAKVSNAINTALFPNQPTDARAFAAMRPVPTNTAQQIGFTGEQIGEFFLPLPGGKARLAKRALETAKAGGLTQFQTGDAATAGVSAGITAGLPVVGKVAGTVAPLIRKSAENTMARALGATKEVMKAEAAALAPEMLRRGVKGSRQAMLARAKTTSQEVGKRLGDLYKQAGAVGQTVPGLVIRGELELARDALMVPNKAGTLVPIEGAEGVIKRLNKMAAWVETLGDDIPADHAATIKTTWDRIVARAGLYGPKATASATDAEKAWAIREGAGSFRQLLSQVNPDIAALNREYAFWKGLQDVLKATELRTQAQQGRGLLAAIGGTTGFFSGEDQSLTGRLAAAGGGAAATAYLAKALQSAPFRTRLTGPFKDMLAKALASGSDSEVLSVLRKLTSTLPSQARQALSQ